MRDKDTERQGVKTIGELVRSICEKAKRENTLQPEPTEDELAAERQRDLEKEQSRRLCGLVEKRGVPFKDAERIVTDRLQSTEAVYAAQKLRKAGRGAVLVMSGEPGTGKTTAASWLISEGAPLPYPYGDGRWPPERHPRFIAATWLMRTSLYDRTVWDTLKHCSILVIDDLGVEFNDGKGVFRTNLDGLFDARYAGYGWTMITTNLARDKFLERYGNRLESRLNESGRGFVHIHEKGLRKK